MFRNRVPGGPDEILATLAPLWTDSEYILSGIIVEGKTVHLRAIATCQDAELAGNVADTVTAATTLVRNMLRSVHEKEQNIPEFARFAMETGEGLLKSAKVERAESMVKPVKAICTKARRVTPAGSLLFSGRRRGRRPSGEGYPCW